MTLGGTPFDDDDDDELYMATVSPGPRRRETYRLNPYRITFLATHLAMGQYPDYCFGFTLFF